MLEIIAVMVIVAAVVLGPMLADKLIDDAIDAPSHYEREASDDLLDAARGRF